MARLTSVIEQPQHGCAFRSVGSHMDITVNPADRHRWSPCVQLEFREEVGTTVVHGLIGPHPNLWTLYAFINITILAAVAFGLMLGAAQWSLEMTAWGFWSLPIGGAMLLGMYGVSQLGRRLAAEQTVHLMALIDATLNASPVREGSPAGASGQATERII